MPCHAVFIALFLFSFLFLPVWYGHLLQVKPLVTTGLPISNTNGHKNWSHSQDPMYCFTKYITQKNKIVIWAYSSWYHYPKFQKKKTSILPRNTLSQCCFPLVYLSASIFSSGCSGLLVRTLSLKDSDECSENSGAGCLPTSVLPEPGVSCSWAPDWRSGGGDWRPE